MTTSIMLGTKFDKNKVYDMSESVGFNKVNQDTRDNIFSRNIHPLHTIVKDLRLQIHKPCYFEDIEGIETEMEFDDFTDRFPDNPGAVDVLKNLYIKLPDLVYHK